MLVTGKSPADDLVAATAPGWPRAFVRMPWMERALPLPWINGTAPAVEGHGFVQMDGMRVRVAENERLCFCCGEPLHKLTIMGRHRASFEDDGVPVRLTDGPGGHPRCLALAAAHCPHLRAQHGDDEGFVIAFAWRGERAGYVEIPQDVSMQGDARFIVRPGATDLTLGELRALAARDPLGRG